MKPQLTPEQEVALGDELGDVMHFEGDDIAVELGIPPRDVRAWTDEEIDRIWAEIEQRFRAHIVTSLLEADV
jgi:hypothetical protein